MTTEHLAHIRNMHCLVPQQTSELLAELLTSLHDRHLGLSSPVRLRQLQTSKKNKAALYLDIIPHKFTIRTVEWWRNGSAFDSRSKGWGFDSLSLHGHLLRFFIFPFIPFNVVFFQNELMCPQKRIALFRCQIRVCYTLQFFIFALEFNNCELGVLRF